MSGSTILTFGGEKGVLRIRGKNPNGTGMGNPENINEYEHGIDGFYTKVTFGNTNPVACSGDIRTLIDYENYNTVSTENAKFCRLFHNCTALTQAPELPITDLASYCYLSMFEGCTSLTQAPELPATTMDYACYTWMFSSCTSLVNAPALPATKLAGDCYGHMFTGCTALTTAPDLPATNLTDGGVYWYMFSNCPNLSYVKMMAINISGSWCLTGWLSGVSSTGTFVKNSAATWDEAGVVPSGWTVETASE